MILGKKVCLYVLIAFLSGCALSAIEPPNSAVDADSIAEEPESIVSTAPPVEGPDSVTNTNSLVEIEFVESAPKDRFVITNIGSCALDELMIDFDLSQSAGKLIFDTTATGAGGIVNITVGNSETTSTRFNNESTAQTNLPACS